MSKKTTRAPLRTDDEALASLPKGMAQRDAAGSKHACAGQALASQRPANATKSTEFGQPRMVRAVEGEHVALTKAQGASSLAETHSTAKTVGNALHNESEHDAPGSLGRYRSGPGAVALTTNQGVPLSDNQSSLKAGVRGPTLLEDFILREKITHFDHERIPERVVHARGCAAHGYFECTQDLSSVSKASLFTEGKRTPVFVRFSTVAGERGSADCARDVRGFAVKFYSDDGNWDLVGNNIPVFFIQDAMKFPDLVHALKPEPHNGIPQAASAHDTFWDFVSLMPESTHMLCWVMSDRAIPRSLRMMQGFGVHTFRLVNAQGASTFVKFHWTPKAGVHSLVWDEAVKLNGADPDFHRRDLWEAIEAGAYPQWTLGVQLFTEEQAEAWSFDVLDATKLVPEELCPLRTVGHMVLDRNADNFFAETEQVAFCTANVVPGIDFSNDPLLMGRHHSYLDTQLSRLGGPNFHELPINAPLAPIANNQRDGIHRMAIARGKVAYEPNSLGGGCPFQAGMKGYVSFPEAIPDDHKLRGKPQKFGEHYSQARLFFNSLAGVERNHMEAGFRFELSKVSVPAIRERMVAGLRHVDEAMASRLAVALGIAMPEALPLAIEDPPVPEVSVSPRLSQAAYPGEPTVATRKVAVLVCPGARTEALQPIVRALGDAEAVTRYVAPMMGTVEGGDGTAPVDATFENSPSVLFDAVLIPADDESLRALARVPEVLSFVTEQYRHGKTIGLVGGDASALGTLGLHWPESKDALQGVVECEGDAEAFMLAVRQHRHAMRGLALDA